MSVLLSLFISSDSINSISFIGGGERIVAFRAWFERHRFLEAEKKKQRYIEALGHLRVLYSVVDITHG